MTDSEKLFRESLFTWCPYESGAPALYPMSPFGKMDILIDRVSEILGLPNPQTQEEIKNRARIYAKFLFDFPGIVRKAELKTGVYEVTDLHMGIDAVSEVPENPTPEQIEEANRIYKQASDNSFSDFKAEIEVTDALIKMVKNAVYEVQPTAYHDQLGTYIFQAPWRHGADAFADAFSQDYMTNYAMMKASPAGSLFFSPSAMMNCKRPYGDRVYYYWDLEDMGVPGILADEKNLETGERDLFSKDNMSQVDELHQKTRLVLQAFAKYAKL